MIHGVPKIWLLHFFITSLDDYLKCQLHLTRPTSYPKAVAHLHEPNYLAWKDSLKRDNLGCLLFDWKT